MTIVLGGTFDPVHLGHIHAARTAAALLGAGEVTLLLAARPWHRSAPAAAAEHRWRMLCLACAEQPLLAPCDLDMHRSGPSFTVEALADLQSAAPLVWCIGSDALALVPSWHRAEDLPSLCSLLVFERPTSAAPAPMPRLPAGFERVGEPEALLARPGGGAYLASEPMLDVSATEVRRAIALAQDASALLPASVWLYIRRHGLYRAGP